MPNLNLPLRWVIVWLAERTSYKLLPGLFRQAGARNGCGRKVFADRKRDAWPAMMQKMDKLIKK
ncbi:hypothetical protein A3841_17925 [Pontibacter flavimaris]|uniref:Uncharacterized protein n=1 Tax=Pontibacter flavimaris TaxID=1797110 RepID=A0A1Q5PDD3_9BACT|nr:hypothetical protein A3841_17925 [Pontibacter flavimaris]